MSLSIKKILPFVIGAILLLAVGYTVWNQFARRDPMDGFIGGNGRIEATEIYISPKLAGRIDEILVDEGDYVDEGQLLVIMNTDTLQAQLSEAQAQYQQMLSAEIRAKAQVALRESDRDAAQAQVDVQASQLDAANRRFRRTSALTNQRALPRQTFDDDQTSVTGAQAAVNSAQAQVTVAEAAIEAAKAELQGARYNVEAAQATIDRITADIRDSQLTAPKAGRVQYRISQPGEVLAAGGKVLNMVDLVDTYMTFFLSTEEAGRVELGQEVRLVLDAAPDYPIPARVTYVASTAQFTPKTVETQEERQKLMFRVKANIDPDVLTEFITYVKVGLPGIAYLQPSPDTEWPERLQIRDFSRMDQNLDPQKRTDETIR